MIRVQDIRLNTNDHTAKVSLFSDTRTEVGTSDIIGFPIGYEIEFGSDVMTATGEMAFMKSDGTWSWV